MTTLTPGQIAKESIDAGMVLTVVVGATAIVRRFKSQVLVGNSDLTAGTSTFGPYMTEFNFRIINGASASSYTVSQSTNALTNSATLTPAQVAANPPAAGTLLLNSNGTIRGQSNGDGTETAFGAGSLTAGALGALLASLPTTIPGSPGQPWMDNGVLALS